MHYLISGVNVLRGGREERRDLVLSGGRLLFDSSLWPKEGLIPIQGRDLHLFPGFTDVHVHLREPGFSYKETIVSGTKAAARGGFTTVISMPNLMPVPDSREHLEEQLRLIREQAVIRVLPLGAITVNQQGKELADMAGMAEQVAGYSDDGRGVQQGGLMEQAMRLAKALDRPIVAHCEDESLLRGGWIHEGAYANAHGHVGIPSASEWRQVERDIALAARTGCALHICHVSTKESVNLIRQAKADGADISCESATHYLTLDDSQLQDEGRFKMNPPIRGRADRKALVEGLVDGTIDMIASDHAPHSAQEKAGGLKGSLNGVVGLEVSFPVLYTALVRQGILPLSRLIGAMTDSPNRRFGIASEQDWTLFDLGERYTIDPSDFLSMGRATPFEGMEVYGKCLLTIASGRVAWQDSEVFAPEVQA